MTEVTEEELYGDIDLMRAIAEAEKAQAEARLAQYTADLAKLELDQERYNLRYQLDGKYSFNRYVNRKSADAFLQTMQVWDEHDPKAPWVIQLNSVGGEMTHGNAVLDELASHSIRGGGNHHVTIKVRGVAASMAGMILQVADDRVMGKHSELMIHVGSGGIHGTMFDLQDEVSYHERWNEVMIDLFCGRANISPSELRQSIHRRDWYMSADEAVSWGFADRIG